MKPLADHPYFDLLADRFAVLSSPVRLRILHALFEGAQTVSHLAACTGVRLQNVSQHLRLMRNQGLVTRRKRGQEVLYGLADERLVQMLETMRKMIADSVQREETRG